MTNEYTVTCVDSEFAPCQVVEEGVLSEHLHACNSPILFGCRSGLCGVCLVEIVEGKVLEPSSEEQEALAVYAPGNAKARLACQIRVIDNLKIRNLE